MLAPVRPSAAAVLAVAAVAVAALAPATAGASGHRALRFWSHQTSFVMRDAAGTALAHPRQPAAGMSFTSTDHDFAGTHAKHAGRMTATDHLTCTFTKVDEAHGTLVAVCDAQIALPGGMVLSDHVTVNLAAPRLTFPLTGGTGRYAHVRSGTATSHSYSPQTSDTDLVISL